MKAYIFKKSEGDYDAYQEWVTDVLIGPEDVLMADLNKEYAEFLRNERAKIKNEWQSLPKAEKRGSVGLAMRYRKVKCFVDWLCEKGFKRIPFEE